MKSLACSESRGYRPSTNKAPSPRTITIVKEAHSASFESSGLLPRVLLNLRRLQLSQHEFVVDGAFRAQSPFW
jgi:hypothetical protein